MEKSLALKIIINGILYENSFRWLRANAVGVCKALPQYMERQKTGLSAIMIVN